MPQISYISPGCMGEKFHLYMAYVEDDMKIHEG